MSLIEKEKNNGQNEHNLPSSYIESTDVGHTELTYFVNFSFLIQSILFLNASLRAGKRMPLALLRRVRW